MKKTALRKEIEQTKWDKLLLKDASLFQIIKSLYRRHRHDIHCVVLALSVGLGIGLSV